MLEKDRKWWKSFHKGLAEQSRYIKSSPPPEVDQPTYEVVGEIERLDQRDTIQSRMMIKDPNSPEYMDYYSRHPEFKEIDDKSGIMIPSGHLTRKIKPKNRIGETAFSNLGPYIIGTILHEERRGV